MLLRRIAPWIASLLAHAALVFLVPLDADLRGTREPVTERRVVLEFDAAGVLPPEPASRIPDPSIASSALEMPATLPLPSTAALHPVADTPASARVVTAPGGVPSAREVLTDLPAPSAAPAAAAGTASLDQTVRVEWTGTPRTVVREVKPRFPTIFSTTGQEAAVEARITVTPLGAVVDVEITRSSGYTEIDAAVEAALRQCLYSRIEGKQNQIGTVYYRFPLEKRD
jgi:TonB family protein